MGDIVSARPNDWHGWSKCGARHHAETALECLEVRCTAAVQAARFSVCAVQRDLLTVLGLKGSQVQILSSRRCDGRFPCYWGAAHQSIYQRKRSLLPISSRPILDLGCLSTWSLCCEQERIWSGVPAALTEPAK
jgi:hypothetical protein